MKRRAQPLRFVDLFAGIGGFHRAARHVLPDSRCVLAVERDVACQEVYRAAFPKTPLIGDVHEITRSPLGGGASRDATSAEIAARVPEHELLFAGFPCQPFSKGGHQLGLREQTQGTLFHDILRLIEARRPHLVILENVANLVHHDEGRTWKVIVENLRATDYSVDPEPLVLSPHDLPLRAGGAPQNRPRVYVVAADLRYGVSAPRNSDLVAAAARRQSASAWSIASIFNGDDHSTLELDARERAWLEAWDDFVKLVPAATLPGFPIWVDAWYGNMRRPIQRPGSGAALRQNRTVGDSSELRWWSDFVAKNEHFYTEHGPILDRWVARHDVDGFPDSRRKFEWQARSFHPTREGRTIRDLLVQLRPSGIRVKPPTYAPALVAMAQTPIVGVGRKWRRIGPSEAAALQGINDFRPWLRAMRDGKHVTPQVAYRQLGNAVNVGVAAFVLRRALESTMPTVLRARHVSRSVIRRAPKNH